DSPGTHYGIFSNRNSAEQSRSRPDRRSPFHQRQLTIPIGFALRPATTIGCPGIAIVNEGHTVADKNIVFHGHSFTDKGVTGDFAARPNPGVFLDLDERADPGFVANLTTVKIDESKDTNIAPQLHIWRDELVSRSSVAHTATGPTCTALRAGAVLGMAVRSRLRAKLTGAPFALSEAEAASRIVTS